jgi:alpha-methylacyl-CoA racemase
VKHPVVQDPAELSSPGPLAGLKVVELAGLGPAPFACMMLADAGADVLRVDRLVPGAEVSNDPGPPDWDLLNRGRRSIAVDLKNPQGVELVLDLASRADVMVEGFRPGVAEQLGLGPDDCLAVNPSLVYGRMTGWGQDGPMAHRAGHDINYIALSGALWSIGREGSAPVPPLNLVGDFGGGGMLLAFGVLAAVLSALNSGQGQVVDASMVDGSASLMTMAYSLRNIGLWREDTRGVNLLDTGAHFYEVYETSDGKWFSVGAIEPKFYARLLVGLGLEGEELPGQMDRSSWPAMKERFASIFKTKTRDQWAAVFDGRDACAVPVLSPWEAHLDPHNVERGTFVEIDGVLQPGPSPRFSATPSAIRRPPPRPGSLGNQALGEWGIDAETIEALRAIGALG